MAYIIEFADCVKKHFNSLTANQRSTIIGSIEKQLIHEPLKEA